MYCSTRMPSYIYRNYHATLTLFSKLSTQTTHYTSNSKHNKAEK